MTMQRYPEAQQDATKVLKIVPGSAEAHYQLALIYLATGAEANRKNELREAVRSRPDLQVRIELAQELIDSGSAKAARDFMNEAPITQRRTMPFLIQRNWALLAMRDGAALQKGVDEALTVNKHPDLMLQTGLLKLQQNDAAGAQKALEEALSTNPHDLRIVRALARCYMTQKRIPAGSQKFKEYVLENPKSPWAHQALGDWLVLNGPPGDARKEFTDAKALDSCFSPAHMMPVQIDTAEGRLDSAREGLKRVLARDDQNATALYPLANIEVQAGRSDAALEHYKKAIQLQPENVQALNNLAYLLCSTRASPTRRWPMATRASLAAGRRRSPGHYRLGLASRGLVHFIVTVPAKGGRKRWERRTQVPFRRENRGSRAWSGDAGGRIAGRSNGSRRPPSLAR